MVGLFNNCNLENKDDLKHLEYIFTLCHMLASDAVDENDVELGEEAISQFENRMRHFNQDKNGERRVNYEKSGIWLLKILESNEIVGLIDLDTYNKIDEAELENYGYCLEFFGFYKLYDNGLKILNELKEEGFIYE